MVNSYYRATTADRFVTVWPSLTCEAGFYDVVYGVMDDDGLNSEATGIDRVTADEAAAILLTELGVPVNTTVDSVAGMIRAWRAEFDAFVREPVR